MRNDGLVDDDLSSRARRLRNALMETMQLLNLLTIMPADYFTACPEEGQQLIRAISFLVDDLQAAQGDQANPDFRKRHEARLKLGLRRVGLGVDGFFLALEAASLAAR